MQSPFRLMAAGFSLALLAGCISGLPTGEDVAPASTTGVESSTAELPRFVTESLEGSITEVRAGVHSPVAVLYVDGVPVTEENTRGAFTPEPGIKAVVVELVWDDPTFDLDLLVRAPDVEALLVPEVQGTTISETKGHTYDAPEGNVASPDNHAVVRVLDPEVLELPGEWSWQVASKTAVDTAFTVHVSLFYGEAPSQDWSATAS